MVDIDDGIDMDWIRSLTGKDRAEDVVLKPVGFQRLPKFRCSGFTHLDKYPETNPGEED